MVIYSRSPSILWQGAIKGTRRTVSTSFLKPGTFPTAILFGALGIGVVTYCFLPSKSPTHHEQPLTPNHFTPVTIISSEPSGPDTKMLTLAVSSGSLPLHTESTFAPIWSVFVKDDDIQVERPYTPLSGIDSQGRMLFWIKKYPKGEVSRWLHSKKVGDTIELRGPLTTWPWKADVWDEVVMISGGTGITPFCQFFHHVITSLKSPNTRFTLLHASKTPADLPPPVILRPLVAYATQNPDHFKLHLFVDSLDGSKYPTELQVGRIGKTAIQRSLDVDRPRSSLWQKRFGSSAPSTSDRKILFLVCGPEQMIAAISGPFGRNFSQGAVGGVLGDMGYTTGQVYKL